MTTKTKIKKLHQKYAKGLYPKVFFDIVWTHSLIIKDIALQIARDLEKEKGIKVNKKLLELGALVHDIGVYECFDEDLNPDKKIASLHSSWLFRSRIAIKGKLFNITC